MGTTLEAEKKNLNQQLLLNRLPADRNISVHQRSADPLASIFILINKSRQTKLSGRVMIYFLQHLLVFPERKRCLPSSDPVGACASEQRTLNMKLASR